MNHEAEVEAVARAIDPAAFRSGGRSAAATRRERESARLRAAEAIVALDELRSSGSAAQNQEERQRHGDECVCGHVAEEHDYGTHECRLCACRSFAARSPQDKDHERPPQD